MNVSSSYTQVQRTYRQLLEERGGTFHIRPFARPRGTIRTHTLAWQHVLLCTVTMPHAPFTGYQLPLPFPFKIRQRGISHFANGFSRSSHQRVRSGCPVHRLLFPFLSTSPLTSQDTSRRLQQNGQKWMRTSLVNVYTIIRACFLINGTRSLYRTEKS